MRAQTRQASRVDCGGGVGNWADFGMHELSLTRNDSLCGAQTHIPELERVFEPPRPTRRALLAARAREFGSLGTASNSLLVARARLVLTAKVSDRPSAPEGGHCSAHAPHVNRAQSPTTALRRQRNVRRGRARQGSRGQGRHTRSSRISPRKVLRTSSTRFGAPSRVDARTQSSIISVRSDLVSQ